MQVFTAFLSKIDQKEKISMAAYTQKYPLPDLRFKINLIIV